MEVLFASESRGFFFPHKTAVKEAEADAILSFCSYRKKDAQACVRGLHNDHQNIKVK